MQAVVVPGAVAEEQGRRTGLTACLHLFRKLPEGVGVTMFRADALRPKIRRWGELFVKCFAKFLDQFRERVFEVPIAPCTEPIAFHVDGGAKEGVLVETFLERRSLWFA
jgi:hypothetical protein